MAAMKSCNLHHRQAIEHLNRLWYFICIYLSIKLFSPAPFILVSLWFEEDEEAGQYMQMLIFGLQPALN